MLKTLCGCCREESFVEGNEGDEDDKDENEGSKHQGVTAFSLGAALEANLKGPGGRMTIEGVSGAENLMLLTMSLRLRRCAAGTAETAMKKKTMTTMREKQRMVLRRRMRDTRRIAE